MQRIVGVVALIALVAVCAVAQPAADRVTSLPNLDGKLIPMWSGYINIPGTSKYYHYVFVPSQGKPTSDPVILWLNGGPGCSSLDGFFYEHGPYMFGVGNTNITLVPNPYTWTKFASVIYLESPVGVGYTYSNNDLDYFATDSSTASDNLNFLLQFFKSAPAYANLPFYVMGESYAGVYVPTLAVAILNSNQAGNARINLVGTGSGNPVTNSQSDSTLNSWVPFTFGHGLISTSTYNSLQQACQSDGFSCQAAAQQVSATAYNNINPYWIYGTCFNGGSSFARTEAQLKAMFPPNDPINRAAFYKSLQQPQVPCIDSLNAQYYLNRAVATSALHVSNNIQWSICSNSLQYTASGDSMLPNYHTLINANIRVIVFSGDADSVVPYTGTSKWVREEMNLGTPVDDWVPWNYNDGAMNGLQVGGWKTTYNVGAGFTYTTIRGSAHMIMNTPGRAYHAISRWIHKQSI